ncbi:MAG: Fe-S oxidoreductase [Polyangiaceae bacterium]|jgi:Fe-S oxidoreductase|nr:Fe-S oxidoreductase [Polyangiaceae bacterium]
MSNRHGLPLLAQREDELSKCAYCPKLCRATCVVSEAEPREALTPWGKMTSAFESTRGGADAERAELAWGCSNCFRCREACDHRNPVTPTLNDARADYVDQGLAPPRVAALLERASDIEAEHVAANERLSDSPGVRADAAQALLLGCRYAKVFPDEARAAIRLAVTLSGPVRLLRGCCGAWQRAAGAAKAADAAQQRLAAELGTARLLVLDPRCALELAPLRPTPLVALAARHGERFVRAPGAEPVRYHDSCALGRGLGMYDPPRRLLARVTGHTPLELTTSRELSRCSGAGGILPVSMPEVSKAGAARLASEHQALGGGPLVTSCASSLSRLRGAGVAAVDLVTLLESGLSRDD